MCKPACQEYQTCVNNVCMIVGKLVISATWSRVGDGDLIVKTPLGKIIYWNNKGPNNNTDQGQFVSGDTYSTGPEDIFWKINTVPPTGTYYICTETYSFLPIVSTYNPVTFTVRVRTTATETHVYTKTMIQTATGYSTCNSTLPSYVTAFQYP